MGKHIRRVSLGAAAVVALLAAACTPSPPTPNADYQFYAWGGGGLRPLSCAATPAEALLISLPPKDVDPEPQYGPVVETVDGVNEHVARFSHGVGYYLAYTIGEVQNDA